VVIANNKDNLGMTVITAIRIAKNVINGKKGNQNGIPNKMKELIYKGESNG
jgi:hypothetical protein